MAVSRWFSWGLRWVDRVLVLLLIVTPLVVGYFFAVRSQHVVVAVRARAESVVMTLGGAGPRNWYLEGATIALDDGRERSFDGQLEPGPGVTARFERLGKGDLHVVLQSSDSAPAGRLLDVEERPAGVAARSLEIRLPANAAGLHTFPFSGRAVIGDLVGPQTRLGAPILLGGSVDLVGRTLLTRDPFLAGRSELRPGDQIEIAADEGDSVPPSHGFVRVDDEPGMLISSDAEGIGLRTRRFGAEDGFVLRRSTWSTLEFDKWILIIVFLFGAGAQALIAVRLDQWMSKGDAARSAPPVIEDPPADQDPEPY